MSLNGTSCPLLSAEALAKATPMAREKTFECPITPKVKSSIRTVCCIAESQKASSSTIMTAPSHASHSPTRAKPHTTHAPVQTMDKNLSNEITKVPLQQARPGTCKGKSLHVASPSDSTVNSEPWSKGSKKSTINTSISTMDRNSKGFFVTHPSPRTNDQDDPSGGSWPRPPPAPQGVRLAINAPPQSLLHRFGKTLRVGASRVKRKISPSRQKDQGKQRPYITWPIPISPRQDPGLPGPDEPLYSATSIPTGTAVIDGRTSHVVAGDIGEAAGEQSHADDCTDHIVAELEGAPLTAAKVGGNIVSSEDTTKPLPTHHGVIGSSVDHTHTPTEAGELDPDTEPAKLTQKPKYALRRKRKQYELSPRSKAREDEVATEQPFLGKHCGKLVHLLPLSPDLAASRQDEESNADMVPDVSYRLEPDAAEHTLTEELPAVTLSALYSSTLSNDAGLLLGEHRRHHDFAHPLFETRVSLRKAMGIDHRSQRRWSGSLDQSEYQRRAFLANASAERQETSAQLIARRLWEPNCSAGIGNSTKLLILELCDKEKQIDGLNRHDKLREEELWRLREAYNHLSGILSDATWKMMEEADWRDRRDELFAIYAKKEMQYEKAQASMVKYSQKATKLEKALNTMTQKFNSVDIHCTELSEKVLELEGMEEDLRYANTKLGTVAGELADARLTTEKTTAELEAARTELEHVNVELVYTREELDAVKAVLKDTVTRDEQNALDFEKVTAELQDIKAKLADTASEITSTKVDLEKERDSRQALSNENRILKIRTANLEASATARKELQDENEEELVKKDIEIDQLNDQIRVLRGDLARLRDTQDTSKKDAPDASSPESSSDCSPSSSSSPAQVQKIPQAEASPTEVEEVSPTQSPVADEQGCVDTEAQDCTQYECATLTPQPFPQSSTPFEKPEEPRTYRFVNNVPLQAPRPVRVIEPWKQMAWQEPVRINMYLAIEQAELNIEMLTRPESLDMGQIGAMADRFGVSTECLIELNTSRTPLSEQGQTFKRATPIPLTAQESKFVPAINHPHSQQSRQCFQTSAMAVNYGFKQKITSNWKGPRPFVPGRDRELSLAPTKASRITPGNDLSSLNDLPDPFLNGAATLGGNSSVAKTSGLKMALYKA